MEVSKKRYMVPKATAVWVIGRGSVCMERTSLLANSSETYTKRRGYTDDTDDTEEEETVNLW